MRRLADGQVVSEKERIGRLDVGGQGNVYMATYDVPDTHSLAKIIVENFKGGYPAAFADLFSRVIADAVKQTQESSNGIIGGNRAGLGVEIAQLPEALDGQQLLLIDASDKDNKPLLLPEALQHPKEDSQLPIGIHDSELGSFDGKDNNFGSFKGDKLDTSGFPGAKSGKDTGLDGVLLDFPKPDFQASGDHPTKDPLAEALDGAKTDELGKVELGGGLHEGFLKDGKR